MVTIMISYAPNWNAKIDGATVSVINCDDLIYLKLPKGKHTVTLQYGITQEEKISLIFVIIEMLVLFLLLFYWNYFVKQITNWSKKVFAFLQIEERVKEISMEEQTKDPSIEQYEITQTRNENGVIIEIIDVMQIQETITEVIESNKKNPEIEVTEIF